MALYTVPSPPGYVDLGASCPLLQNVPGGTICSWVNITNFPGSGETYISHFSTNGAATASRLGISINQPTGSFRATARRLDADALVSANDPTARSTGVWYHVAITADYSNAGQGQTLRIYVDGVEVVNAGVQAGWTGNSSNTASTRGCHMARASQLLQIDGVCEDIRVYNRALSASEILTIYGARGIDNILSGLINRHLFTGPIGVFASGTSVDLSGTLNGTFTDSPQYIESSPVRWRKKV